MELITFYTEELFTLLLTVIFSCAIFESRRIPQALNQFESQSKTRSTPPGPNNPGMRGPHPGGPPGPHPGGIIFFLEIDKGITIKYIG